MMKYQKIYTVTTNPALDLSGHVKKIIPNEKNYVSQTRIDAGGNAINAARIAKRLGAKPTLLGFLGGTPGDQLRDLLEAEDLDHQFTAIQGNTRTNLTVTNDEDHQQTRFTFPGPKVSHAEIADLIFTLKTLKSPGIIVFGGSTPGKCSQNFYPRLIRAALNATLKVVIDVPAQELKIILSAGLPQLFLMKPNLTEFEMLTKKKFKTHLEIAKTACRFLSKCEIICISLADKGVILVWNHQAWFIQAPHIHPRGTVGAGDSMVGAMVTQFAQNNSLHSPFCQKSPSLILHAIRLGVAAGAATATTEGTSLGKASLIRSLYAKTTTQQIL